MNRYNGNFQSIMISQTSSNSNNKGKNIDSSENYITFIFYIDVDILPDTIQISTLTYLKTVIK